MTVFLGTDRLVLRRFTESDVDNLVELDSDPRVMRFLTNFLTNGKPTPRTDIDDRVLPRIRRLGGICALFTCISTTRFPVPSTARSNTGCAARNGAAREPGSARAGEDAEHAALRVAQHRERADLSGERLVDDAAAEFDGLLGGCQ